MKPLIYLSLVAAVIMVIVMVAGDQADAGTSRPTRTPAVPIPTLTVPTTPAATTAPSDDTSVYQVGRDAFIVELNTRRLADGLAALVVPDELHALAQAEAELAAGWSARKAPESIPTIGYAWDFDYSTRGHTDGARLAFYFYTDPFTSGAATEEFAGYLGVGAATNTRTGVVWWVIIVAGD